MSAHRRGRCSGRIHHPDRPSTRCPNQACTGGLCFACDEKVRERRASHRGPSISNQTKRAEYIRELEGDLEILLSHLRDMERDPNPKDVDAALDRAENRRKRCEQKTQP